jgi:hypothetical protein
MEPAVALEYRGRAEVRPRWVTWLGVASTALGTLGALAGLARARQGWGYLFESRIRWNYPPLPWVPPAYLIAALVGTMACAMLATAGILSLIKPAAGLRFQLWCAACLLPLVVLTAILGAMHLWPHPEFSAASLAASVLMECAVFGTYPAIVVFVVLRGCKTRGHPAAV